MSIRHWVCALGVVAALACAESASAQDPACQVNFDYRQCAGGFAQLTCKCFNSPTQLCSCYSASCTSCGMCCLGSRLPANCTEVKCGAYINCTFSHNLPQLEIREHAARPRGFVLASYSPGTAAVHSARRHRHADDGSIAILDVAQGHVTVETTTVPNVDTVQFEVRRPEGLDVTIDNVRAKLDGLSLGGLTHRVVNNSGQPLVAIRVQWAFYTANDKLITVAAHSWDAWGGANSALPSGRTLDQTRLEIMITPTEQIRRVIATIAYAELSDGSRYGVEANIAPFAERRKNIRAAYAELLDTYRTHGERAMRAQLRSCAAKVDRPGRSIACGEATAVMEERGLPVLIQRLEEVTRPLAGVGR